MFNHWENSQNAFWPILKVSLSIEFNGSGQAGGHFLNQIIFGEVTISKS